MTQKIQSLLETLSSPASIEDLGVVIDAIRDIYAVDHAVYLAISLGRNYAIASSLQGGQMRNGAGAWWRHQSKLGAGTYAPEWGARYTEADFARIDPVVEGARNSFMPMDWRHLDWSGAKRRQFRKEAVECGIGNQGYTVPLRGPDGQFAMFVVNSSCSDKEWDRFIDSNAADMLVIAHFFHQRVIEIEKVFGAPPSPQLSSREEDVLRLIALGRSRGQVADHLKISENTLRVYLDSARHKLGALNVTHAAAIAVNRGIVNI